MSMKSRGKKYYYIYIVASINKVNYVGFTDCLLKRIREHKNGKYENTFSKKYKTNKLVYWEQLLSCDEAFQRERQIKKWRRDKKVELIEEHNQDWNDLYPDIIELSKLNSRIY